MTISNAPRPNSPLRRLRRLARMTLRRLPIVGSRWDPADRRRWLLGQMPPHSVCAEVGVWKGDFSAQILDVVRPRQLHLIDPWQAIDASMYPGTASTTRQTGMERVHRAVLDRFSRQLHDGTVVVHRSTSSQVASGIADDSLDWVYIDGDHSYEGAHEDLDIYTRKVRPGGFVCGDDYDPRNFPGVIRAVDELLASGRVEQVTIRSRQYVLRRVNDSASEVALGGGNQDH